MKRRLAIVIITLVALLLGGCPKEEPSQVNNPAPAAQETTPSSAADDAVMPAAEAAVAAMPTKLGDAAYPLTGLTWVKGEPVTLSPGKVYVVEFWATWCPPCRKSIPHLTELQKKYKDRVTFVGISGEEPGVVKTFVGKQGDNMDYTVATDAVGSVSKGYMTAFRQGGIPTAFVVDAKGRVVWHGHPLGDLEAVLDQVVAGTYNVPG
ncbi:MAG: TlpA family protein disulfide reductase [Phycisphaerales bacterium]|nr:MAG: TlpA family protein disulfide reductase [Phycisphaerales bacterium]